VRLSVIGSSDAFNSGGRGNSCYWLEELNHSNMMVDLGPTALKNLKSMGRDHTALEIICFTHLHGDHIGGFPFWMLDSTYNQIRSSEIHIIGPVGVETRLMDLLRICFGDVADGPAPFDIRFTELRPGEKVSVGGWTIKGFEADHMDRPEQPLCLRVESSLGPSVAFSGDTQYCDGLFEAARNADVLVCECSAMRPPAGRHCTWEEWINYFPRLETKRLILTHLNEEMRANTHQLKVPPPCDLELEFADDGLVFDI